ncbi:TlpA disulfide reductase family protein [Hymenobacter convexus]|uniref:TlpA disulfide reductase family protein n=1 Tax=Hymenobacter sp. CA1UV-4 TaxID=3063782 RepID=UPI0027132693|nr:TlpA disulfide reductase family protein [Hymenobacter sp. CA1UV-4]MDO7851834.1 TlpA disulfide reductase family protein [Hymenobacter sp. CA1UV-4]
MACAQAGSAYQIQGRLNARLSAPASVSLFYGDSIASTAILDRGRFAFAGTVSRPQKALLIFNPKGRRPGPNPPPYPARGTAQGFYLEAATITVASPDSLSTATITGSPLTDDWLALQAALAPVKKLVDAMEQEFDRTASEKRRLPEFQQRRAAQQAAISAARVQTQAAFIRTHRNSPVSLDQLTLMSNTRGDRDSVVALLRALSPQLQLSGPARALAGKAAGSDAPRVGSLAPEFVLADPAGRLVSLADYAGKTVLLEFGASWCTDCRAHNAARAKAYAAFQKKGFDIINVSIDMPEERDKWARAVAADHPPGVHLLDSANPGQQAWARYHLEGVPQNFLVGPSGIIQGVNLYGDALLAALQRLLR